MVSVLTAMTGNPTVGLVFIDRDTFAALVHRADLDLRRVIAAFRGDPIPVQRLREVLWHAVAVLMDDRQIVGGIDVATLCPRLPQGKCCRRVAPALQYRCSAQVGIYVRGDRVGNKNKN